MNRRLLWPALALTAVTLAASAYAADRAPASRAPAPQAPAPTVMAPAEPDSPGDAIAPDEWMAGLAGDDEWLDSDDAAGPGGGPGDGPGGGMRRGPGMAGGPWAQLKLSDDQRQRLEDVHYRHLKKVIPMQSDLRLAALDLRHLMHAENPDARAIDAQIDKIASMRASVGKARVASLLEARAILTPEQRKMWRDHAAMGGMRGMRGAPGARGRREMMMRRGPGGGGGDGPEGHDL